MQAGTVFPAAVLLLATSLSSESAHAASAEPPVLRVLDSHRSGTPILSNGGFEKLSGDAPEGWRPFQKGFRTAAAAGRGGSTAVRCENGTGKGEYGASRTIRLQQKTPLPLVVRGWSKARGVDGGPDSGYSLYVDLVHRDGTPLWGQTASFRCGSHDWEQREFLILPSKPVASLTVYGLFRGHRGTVWFDDIAVEEIRPEGSTVLFQGLPVEAVTPPAETFEKATPLGPAGFLVRDVAAGGGFHRLAAGRSKHLGLELRRRFDQEDGVVSVTGRLTDTTGRDRAVTLVFALSVDAAGWRWGDDVRSSRVIAKRGEYAVTARADCGSTGTISTYPFAAVWNRKKGLAIGIDPARPAVYRLAYNAGTRMLLAACDFALVKDTERFPSAADFHFVLYRVDPDWGFRSAAARYQEIFPQAFVVRSKRQGIWMPFTDVSTVEDWKDFGFRFHEGNNNVRFDDASDILSFRYTEPMTWWMRMDRELPRTAAEAVRLRDELAAGSNRRLKHLAAVSRTAGMYDEGGAPALAFRNTPWCDGAIWSLNPNPHIPGELNAATIHWNDGIKETLYGPKAKGHLDGEYLDSLEGYVTSELNFRREHFRHSTVPLTFARRSCKPALFKGLAVYEFTRWMSKDVHRMGKLLFANSVPYRFPYLCPLLDVMGTETNWLRGKTFQPPPRSRLALWRTMAGAKPYLLLMNTNYDAFTPDLVERYFAISLLYGFYPSMFSHNASQNPYWKNPAWYGRDRHLFRKYIPVIRQVAEAGWRPVTYASCDAPSLLVERFGPDSESRVYFTVLNDGKEPRTGMLTIDAAALQVGQAGQAGGLKARNLLTRETCPRRTGGFEVRLGPGEAAALEVRARAR